MGEEGAGEDFEGQVAGLVGEAQTVEEGSRGLAVVAGEGIRKIAVDELESRSDVDICQSGQWKCGAGEDEAQKVERGSPRDRGEGVGGAASASERIVGDRPETVESGVGTAEQIAQVVVLPEEGVESPAHGPSALHRPCADTPAEAGPGFDDRDLDSALGQNRRGGETGDAGSDDGHGFGAQNPTPPGIGRKSEGVPIVRGQLSSSDRRLRFHCQSMSTAVIMAKPNPKSSMGMSKGKRMPRYSSGL